jgi:hypothetical protein
LKQTYENKSSKKWQFSRLSRAGSCKKKGHRLRNMSTFSSVRQIASIILLANFLFVSVLMPYGNFDDNHATRLLYGQQQKQDPDLTLSEFVFERLLCVGELFENEDDDDHDEIPLKDSRPVQTLQIQAGFLDCYKPVLKMQELPAMPEKPTCLFRENKFGREFSSFVFHPPAIFS